MTGITWCSSHSVIAGTAPAGSITCSKEATSERASEPCLCSTHCPIRRKGKESPKPFDLVSLKTVFGKWQLALARDGWNALFRSNHDLPRAVSRYGDAINDHSRSAKMVATVLHPIRKRPSFVRARRSV